MAAQDHWKNGENSPSVAQRDPGASQPGNASARPANPAQANQAQPNRTTPVPVPPVDDPDALARDIGNQLDKIRRKVAAAQKFLEKPSKK